MTASELRPGVWYVVRMVHKIGKPGSLRVGDHIRLENNGDLSCKQAPDWIEAMYVTEELAKVSAEIEKDALRLEAIKLKKRLYEIDELLK